MPIAAFEGEENDSPLIDVDIPDAQRTIENDQVLAIDFENRLLFEEQFDPELWVQWQIFVQTHAVCP